MIGEIIINKLRGNQTGREFPGSLYGNSGKQTGIAAIL